jgi:hypothetical protein
LEKTLDDMLLSTPKGPVLRSSDRADSKPEKDSQMPPPRDRKGKLKKLARKKRLEKLLESKQPARRQNCDPQSECPKFRAEDFGNSISQALIPHL